MKVYHNTANTSRNGRGRSRNKDKPIAKTIMEKDILLPIVKKLKPIAPKTANTFENTVPLSNNEQNVESTPNTQTNGSFNPNSNVFMLDGAHSSLPTQNIVPIILSPSFTQYSTPQFSVPQYFVMDSLNKSVNPVVNKPSMLHNPNISDVTSIPNPQTTTINIEQNTNDKVVELLPEDPKSSCLNNKYNTFVRNISTCDTVLESTGKLSPQVIPENQRDLTVKENKSKIPESSKTSEAKVPKFVTIAPRPDQQVELRPSSTKTSGESRNEQNKLFRCRVCFTTYRDRLLMIKHVNQKHVNVTCKKCNRSFENRILLSRHAEEHRGTNYKCQVCPEMFKHMDQLRLHLSKEHLIEKRKTFLCNICGKTIKYFKSRNVQVHLLTHSNVKAFVCEICGKRFRTPSNLSQHKHVHDMQRPFSCSVCEKSFKLKNHLKEHMRVHSKVSNSERKRKRNAEQTSSESESETCPDLSDDDQNYQT